MSGDIKLKFLDMKTKNENKTKLVRLTKEFVEIQTNVVEGIHMEAFSNSASGRDFVENLDIPQDIKSRIFDVWGDTPTVEELDFLKEFEQKIESE